LLKTDKKICRCGYGFFARDTFRQRKQSTPKSKFEFSFFKNPDQPQKIRWISFHVLSKSSRSHRLLFYFLKKWARIALSKHFFKIKKSILWKREVICFWCY